MTTNILENSFLSTIKTDSLAPKKYIQAKRSTYQIEKTQSCKLF